MDVKLFFKLTKFGWINLFYAPILSVIIYNYLNMHNCLYFLFIGSGKKEDGENINEIIDNKTSNKELFWAVVNYRSKNQSQILENKGFIICLLLGVVLEIIKYFIK